MADVGVALKELVRRGAPAILQRTVDADLEAFLDGYALELDKDHGCLEARRDWISETTRYRAALGRATEHREGGRTYQSGGTQTLERRDFIHTIATDAKRFAHVVRGHWGVEN